MRRKGSILNILFKTIKNLLKEKNQNKLFSNNGVKLLEEFDKKESRRNFLIEHKNDFWVDIEKLNAGLGINRNTVYFDENGYLRWISNNRLCHRDIAFENQLHYGKNDRFSECDVHHKDKNKLNNNPDNLEVLTREEHEVEHNQIIIYEGKKYIKLAKISKIYQKTTKSVMVGRKWIPNSQIVYKNEFIYVSDWFYNQYFKN
jgi:hypothetical protein